MCQYRFSLSIFQILLACCITITAEAQLCTDSDQDGYSIEGGDCGLVDCDDANSGVHPGTAEICDGVDTNCDGYVPYTDVDADGDGVLWCAGDCDDNDANRFPGNMEICDGIDNDCNGIVPSLERDRDNDGFRSCDDVPDCNDGIAIDHPGAYEICGDGRDNNCNGKKDESGCICPDADGDGQTSSVCGGLDCDDNEPTIFLGAPEICDDYLDNDCDGLVDLADPDATGCSRCNDADGDGYAGSGDGCGPLDCDDSNPSVHPGAVEICDALDTNCDGIIPMTDRDMDEDGFAWCAGDCNDNNPYTYPGADETCDGIDNDCNGILGAGERDVDGDGFRRCDAVPDCNDMNDAVNPGSSEICGDLLDNDCDGMIDEGEDRDGDGYTTCNGDCNDQNPDVSPGAVDICSNGIDEDCSGSDEVCLTGDALTIEKARWKNDDGGRLEVNATSSQNGAALLFVSYAGENLPMAFDQSDDRYELREAGIPYQASIQVISSMGGRTLAGVSGDGTECEDNDGDGYGIGSACLGPDCDDKDSSINPSATEICENGLDENCDLEDDICLYDDKISVLEAEWQDDDGGELIVKAVSSQGSDADLEIHYDGNSYTMTFDAEDNRHEIVVGSVPLKSLVEISSSLGGTVASAVRSEDERCTDDSLITFRSAEWENVYGGELVVRVNRCYRKSADLKVQYGENSYTMNHLTNGEYHLILDDVPYLPRLEIKSSKQYSDFHPVRIKSAVEEPACEDLLY